jgi:uncharacterized protein YbjT (DUF2867 family)
LAGPTCGRSGREDEVILVVGATGLVGKEVCRQLSAAGVAVRALIRPSADPNKIADLRDLPVATMVGDLRDPASLERACTDVDAVVCTASSMPFSYEAGVNDIAWVDLDGVRSLIDTAKTAGVARFVYVSFSGGMERRSPLRDAKRTVEHHLQESRLDWTILRPSYFMEVWLSPAVGFDASQATATVPGSGDRPISWISLRDVASFVVACLGSSTTSRRIIELGGPRPVTPNEVIRIFEATSGRPFSTSYLSVSDLEAQQAAASDPMQVSFAALMRCYADGDPIEMGRTADLLPAPMTSVEVYAASLLPAAAAS